MALLVAAPFVWLHGLMASYQPDPPELPYISESHDVFFMALILGFLLACLWGFVLTWKMPQWGRYPLAKWVWLYGWVVVTFFRALYLVVTDA